MKGTIIVKWQPRCRLTRTSKRETVGLYRIVLVLEVRATGPM
jgi:hypothetical protein